MATLIANPMYDSVFKFLMQDNEAAKILISALLRMPVLELTLRTQDVVDQRPNGLGILRIDFAAKVELKDKSTKIVTIELQKAKLQSEVMRFRKYLGAQYQDKNKAKLEIKSAYDRDGNEIQVENYYPYPIIPIFILGHKLVDVDEPVLYVERIIKNSENTELEGVESKDFIDCLSHNMIVVQVPCLKKSHRNHVERLLSIFDQVNVFNKKYFAEADKIEAGDSGMDVLVNCLIKAAADKDLAHIMDVEDEIDHEIDNRDKEIEILKAQLIQEKISSAKAMKSYGMPISVIAKYSGLSEKDIEGL